MQIFAAHVGSKNVSKSLLFNLIHKRCEEIYFCDSSFISAKIVKAWNFFKWDFFKKTYWPNVQLESGMASSGATIDVINRLDRIHTWTHKGDLAWWLGKKCVQTYYKNSCQSTITYSTAEFLNWVPPTVRFTSSHKKFLWLLERDHCRFISRVKSRF